MAVSGTRLRERPPGPSRVHWHWWVILGLAAVSLALGALGFSRYYASQGQPRSWWHVLYVTLQLFTLESGPVPGSLPWELNAARFLAPVVPAWALVRTILLLFGARLQRLRARRCRDHVVVCGLGRKGLALAGDFRAHGVRVVALERDADNENIENCRSLGIPVIVQDAADPRSLEDVRAERARHVIAVTGDDGTNVEIAVHAHRLARRTDRSQHGLLRCWVQVVDLRLAGLLERHHMLTDSTDRFAARIFNPYESSVRIALREHPLDYEWIGPDDERSVRLITIGFGQMGEALTLHAARVGHYANGRPIRITVIDRDAARKGRVFRERHPDFEQVAAIEFVEGEADDPAILSAVERIAEAGDELTTIAICFDDDSRCLSCALDILPRIRDTRVPILLRMSDSVGLATLVGEEGDHCAWARRISPFGIVNRVCNRDEFLNERIDTLARVLHDAYIGHKVATQPKSRRPSLQPWNLLDEAYKDSSRHLADHIPVKLRAVRCHASTDELGREPVEAFEPEEVEILARMEHARWCAERILSGWRIGEDDFEKRTTPHITGWGSLDEPTREIDREMVRKIPAAMERVGERAYRSDASAGRASSPHHGD